MAISSLIIDVAQDSSGSAAVEALSADARVTMGPRVGNRQAIVVECSAAQDDIAFFQKLQTQPGIRLVTLVQAFLDEQSTPMGVGAEFL